MTIISGQSNTNKRHEDKKIAEGGLRRKSSIIIRNLNDIFVAFQKFFQCFHKIMNQFVFEMYSS